MNSLHLCFKTVLLLAVTVSGSLSADLRLTENGKTSYKIFLKKNPSDNLKYAAHELKIHLEEASGTTFQILHQTPAHNTPHILLTEKDPKLETGEFTIRTQGKNLLLSGGGESGIHHAVHDFLEKDCGYIWYDVRGGKKVPDLKNFTLKNLSRKKKFSAVYRAISPDYFFHRPEAHYFLYRHGLNTKTRMNPLPGMKQKKLKIAVGVNDVRRASPASHTFFDYIPDKEGKSRISFLKKKGYFKEHPEYFTMNKQGKRVVLQLCFSNKALRDEFTKNICEHIRRTPKMNIFSVTAYDFPGKICHCKPCQAAVRKYKTNGAPVFLYVKELAQKLEKEFPHVMLWTYAYRKEQTEFPPVGLKLPDNVIIDFCPIDDDMSKPLDAPVNTETLRNLKNWKKVCKNIWIGYYVSPYAFSHMAVPPFGNVYRIIRDFALCRKAGVTGFGIDHAPGNPTMGGFIELQTYLMARLLRDPDLDAEFLIKDFMEFEYGKAAGLMKRYLDEVEKTCAKTNSFISWSSKPGAFAGFYPGKDVVRHLGYFDEMERLTRGNPTQNFAVRRVRFPLDLMALSFFRRIKKEVPSWKTDAKTLGEKILKTYREAAHAFYTVSEPQIRNWQQRHLTGMENLVRNLVIQMSSEARALPKDLFGKTDPALIYEFYPIARAKTRQEPDPEAAWGYTMVNDDKIQGFPIQVLQYEPVKNIWKIFSKIDKAKEGMEGKYAFYFAGTTQISPNYNLRFHFPNYKYLFMINPGEVWLPGMDDTVYIYISLKFTGPRYYKGSTLKDSVSCDRIVIVRKTNR